MKKALAILMGILMVGLTACGSKSEEAADSAQTDASAAEESTEEEASEEVSSDKEVVIEWSQYQIEVAEQTQALAQAYMDEHPNVTIEVTVDASHLDILQARAATGDLPDIFMTNGYADLVKWADYIEDLSDCEFTEQLVDASKTAVTDSEGKIVGLPMQLSGFGIVYNKGIFEEYGIEIPKTLAELETVCETLQANGVTPFINQYKDGWLLGEIVGTGIGRGEDAKGYIDEISAGTKTVAEKPEMQDMMKFLQLTLDYGQENPLSGDWNSACTALGMEEGAMLVEGIWVYDTIKEVNPDIEIGLFGIPFENDAPLAVDVNGALHVWNGSENKEVAKDILNWIVTSEAGQQFINDCAYISAYKSQSSDNINSCGEDVLSYVNDNNTSIWGWIIAPSGYESSSGEVVQSYILGTTDKEETLKQLDDLWQQLLENA